MYVCVGLLAAAAVAACILHVPGSAASEGHEAVINT
jgi:hypothetical protein